MKKIATKAEALQALSNADSTLVELVRTLEVLDNVANCRIIKIGISSSVTVDLLRFYLRKCGFLNGVNINIIFGNYDDPIGDIDLFIRESIEEVILIPFFDNLLPSFEAQMSGIDMVIIDAKESELRQRYRTVLEKARTISKIYLGTFHRIEMSSDPSGIDAVSVVIERFNTALREEAKAYANISMIDTEDIIRMVGQHAAFDRRFYFRNKAPYTGSFMNELARRISATARGFGTYYYKVLALDCDNTLWGGVVGEDLLPGIKLNRYDYPGNIFWCMQHEFAALERQGILLALVSKNNPADVDEVLREHPDMVLRESQIVIKKVNWEDKASNLRALASELNVGLDSIIFLDDSPFECEAIRQQLPMVKTMQVPSNLSDYPSAVAEIKHLMLPGGISPHSRNKTAQYKQRAGAEELKAHIETQEEYLASLELKVELTINARSSVGRISELSQKTNQFNLTTHRYSIAEIEYLMQSDSHSIYSLVVNDKFGDAGLTGVAVMQYEGSVATVKNFFMSCRVIGRGIELGIWTRIISDAVKRGCTELYAEYIPSEKNTLTADFYDRLGIKLKKENGGVKQYSIAIADFMAPEISWIEVNDFE